MGFEPSIVPEQPGGGPIVAATSREIVRLYARLLGRGPTRARTHLREDHVICILEDIFTRVERTLIDAGRGAQVLELRGALHQEMKPELIRIVEGFTGRTVRLCIGQFDADADLGFEFFSLNPREAAEDA